MIGFVSSLVEAWQELRINKVRILLALLGVALSVAALTSVVGVGNLAREGYKEQSERNGGRVATLSLGVYGPSSPDPATLEKAYQASSNAMGSPHPPMWGARRPSSSFRVASRRWTQPSWTSDMA